jgi:predicted nicotinamide N-methyase
VTVELQPDVVFQLLEVLAQPRPNHWARVWPTAVAMSRWLLSEPREGLPSSAVELGCGMGLVSLTLAHLGVTIEGTDRQPLALVFAEENAARNGLLGFTTRALEWSGEAGAATQLLVASDVVYEAAAPATLFALVHSAGLLAPGGRLVLGVPNARIELMDELLRLFSDVGYAHREEAWTVHWDGRDEAITLHVLERPLSTSTGSA